MVEFKRQQMIEWLLATVAASALSRSVAVTSAAGRHRCSTVISRASLKLATKPGPAQLLLLLMMLPDEFVTPLRVCDVWFRDTRFIGQSYAGHREDSQQLPRNCPVIRH